MRHEVKRMLQMFESKDSNFELSKHFPFEIHAVIAWCRDDEVHQRERMKRKGEKGTGDNQASRFRDNEELRFCLRSIFFHLPWVAKIYVLCADYQRPDEYIDPSECHELVEVVSHSRFIPKEFLPTFNSQVIEAFLHMIPNLSEHFIYFNDDFFVGRSLRPNYFFSAESGAPRYNLENSFVPERRRQKRKDRPLTMHARAWINNTLLLNILFGETGRRNYPSHVAVPMLRSSFKQAWDIPVVRSFLLETAMSPFRKETNMYLIGFLVYFNIHMHLGTRRPHIGCFFHDIEEGDDVDGLMSYMSKARPFLFCINDGGGLAGKERDKVKKWLFRLFPVPCRFEPSRYRNSVGLLKS